MVDKGSQICQNLVSFWQLYMIGTNNCFTNGHVYSKCKNTDEISLNIFLATDFKQACLISQIESDCLKWLVVLRRLNHQILFCSMTSRTWTAMMDAESVCERGPKKPKSDALEDDLTSQTKVPPSLTMNYCNHPTTIDSPLLIRTFLALILT